MDINLYAKQLSTVKIDKDNFNQDNDKVTMIGKIYGLQYPILTNQWKYGVQQHTEWNISVRISATLSTKIVVIIWSITEYFEKLLM